MTKQAEYAFKQALGLCPESPEANFRLAQLYIEQNRVDDAIDVLTALQKLDPLNSKITSAIDQLHGMKQQHGELDQLEQSRAASPRDSRLVAELAQAYYKTGQQDKIIPLCDSYLTQTNLGANDMLQICQIYMLMNQVPRALLTLQMVVAAYPDNSQAYFNIAVVEAVQAKTDDALDALEKAIQITPALREQARSAPQFNNLHANQRFQALVTVPNT